MELKHPWPFTAGQGDRSTHGPLTNPLDEAATEPGVWDSVRHLGTYLSITSSVGGDTAPPPPCFTANNLNTRCPLDENTMDTGAHRIPVPGHDPLSKWPVKIPRNLKGAREAITASQFLRIHFDNDATPYLAEICREDTTIILRTEQGVEIGRLETDFGNPTARALEGIVKQAETLGRAQHLLELGKVHEGDSLRHGVRVEAGRFVGGDWRMVRSDEPVKVVEGESVCVKVKNEGSEVVFVSGFGINVAGDITAVAGEAGLAGYKLSPGQSFAFGSGRDGDGLEVIWPPSVPRAQPVDARFLFIVAKSAMDLGCVLAANPSLAVGGKSSSKPEMLTSLIASGTSTNIPTASGSTQTLYSTIEIPFSISPRQVQATVPTLWQSADELGSPPLADTPELVSKACSLGHQTL